MLDNYIADMKDLLSPVIKDEIVRADKTDVWYNIGQIERPIKDIKKELGIECGGNYHTIPAVESAEERAKRLKEERNYTKLENFRKNNLVSFASRINDKVGDIWKIYNVNVKPFEETDDAYRKSLNGLYNACTDTGDKILDTAGTVGKVALVFLEAVAAVLVGAVVLSLLPGELVVGLILAPIVGCIVLAATPEEYVPNWLKDEKEKSDNIIKTIKGGPVAIVEAIGQGLADTVQTPEGIASAAGTVTGLILTFGLAKKIKSNVKTKTDGGKINFENEIPRNGEEWYEFLKHKYGADNVEWNFNTIEDILKDPTRLKGYSPEQLEKILGDGWTRGAYGSSGDGWKFTKGDVSIFYHAGGG